MNEHVIILENMPPVVRIVFRDSKASVYCDLDIPKTPPEAPPDVRKGPVLTFGTPEPAFEPPPAPKPFQITIPGRYRLRDGQEVDLLPLPKDNFYYEDGFRWYGIIPDDGSGEDEGSSERTTASSHHTYCDTWTPDGRWFGPFCPGWEEDWDVVAGPLPPVSDIEEEDDDREDAPDQDDDRLDPVPPVPPVVGHRFRTRSGDVVVVREKDDHGLYPFNGPGTLSWTEKGWEYYYKESQPSGNDLVEDLGPVDPPSAAVPPPEPAPPEPVRIFPSWLHERFRYVARDESGNWIAFESKPCIEGDQRYWSTNPDETGVSYCAVSVRLVDSKHLPSIVPDVPWTESLIERPPGV